MTEKEEKLREACHDLFERIVLFIKQKEFTKSLELVNELFTILEENEKLEDLLIRYRDELEKVSNEHVDELKDFYPLFIVNPSVRVEKQLDLNKKRRAKNKLTKLAIAYYSVGYKDDWQITVFDVLKEYRASLEEYESCDATDKNSLEYRTFMLVHDDLWRHITHFVNPDLVENVRELLGDPND